MVVIALWYPSKPLANWTPAEIPWLAGQVKRGSVYKKGFRLEEGEALGARIRPACRCWLSSILSHSVVSDFATPWQTVAHQAPLSMGFSRQEYWSRCHALLQGIFSTQGLNLCLLCLLHWQLDSLPLVPPGKPLVSSYITFLFSVLHFPETFATIRLFISLSPRQVKLILSFTLFALSPSPTLGKPSCPIIRTLRQSYKGAHVLRNWGLLPVVMYVSNSGSWFSSLSQALRWLQPQVILGYDLIRYPGHWAKPLSNS